jgi:hypothetical protein
MSYTSASVTLSQHHPERKVPSTWPRARGSSKESPSLLKLSLNCTGKEFQPWEHLSIK